MGTKQKRRLARAQAEHARLQACLRRGVNRLIVLEGVNASYGRLLKENQRLRDELAAARIPQNRHIVPASPFLRFIEGVVSDHSPAPPLATGQNLSETHPVLRTMIPGFVRDMASIGMEPPRCDVASIELTRTIVRVPELYNKNDLIGWRLPDGIVLVEDGD